MIELAQVREQYRAGKTALFASLASSGASTRGIRSALQKLARHTDSTLQLLWERASFPAASHSPADKRNDIASSNCSFASSNPAAFFATDLW